MAGSRALSQTPIRVVVNLTNPGFADQVEVLRAQVKAAGVELEVIESNTPAQLLDVILQHLRSGPVAVVDQGLVTGQAMIDALIKGHWSASACLVKPSSVPTVTHDARVMHKQVVSAATIDHLVTAPTHTMLGFVRIGGDEKSQNAIAQARDYFSDSIHKADLVDLITVALVRAACQVVAIGVTGLCDRADSANEISALRTAVASQDEQEIRTQRALRADDGFYSTFVLRKLSRKLSMIAVQRGWTPNQITLTSLIMALVVAGFFATGWWPLMLVGAIGVQAAIIIDCADGEVARYTGVSSQRGAWLDAATDRIKEYAIYAGLAVGASQHDMNLWPLAMGVMVLQTVRHLGDYNFQAVQVVRETAVLPLALTNHLDSGVVSNGSILDTSAALNSNSKVRWLKKVIHFPIGERWLVISVGALFNAPAFALYALLIFGFIGLAYTSTGRILRSKNWKHPQAISGCEILERQIEPGLGADWFWADGSQPLKSKFAWTAPAVLVLIELGLVLAVARNHPIAYLWIFAVAFHHYDALYRSLAGFEIPKNIKTYGLGFLGRSLIIVITSLGFVISLETTLLLGGIAFTALFVGYASKQWMQQIS
jgi:phosphatidylserine synthase